MIPVSFWDPSQTYLDSKKYRKLGTELGLSPLEYQDLTIVVYRVHIYVYFYWHTHDLGYVYTDLNTHLFSVILKVLKDFLILII